MDAAAIGASHPLPRIPAKVLTEPTAATVLRWRTAAAASKEIVGGLLWGSMALIADGLHMSTHAGALVIAALAYFYARRHARDERFVFGTGKLGDLAAFSSALVLAWIDSFPCGRSLSSAPDTSAKASISARDFGGV